MQESVEELLRKGQTSLNLGNPKEAGTFYDMVLAQNPHHVEALLKKGHILGKMARYRQAVTSYDMVLAQDGGNLLALLNKGLAHHYLAEYDTAVDCFEKVLAEKPGNATALYNKASSLIKAGRTKEGLEILLRVTKTDISFKAKARFDIDFEEIRKSNEFKAIVLS